MSRQIIEAIVMLGACWILTQDFGKSLALLALIIYHARAASPTIEVARVQ